ncbi:MAG: hypothetical protein KAS32_22570 [Candidatus Peribacteraceae bacterium]|nr:hypothetical protein [Candidatus Peribacteraceae bacterium]
MILDENVILTITPIKVSCRALGDFIQALELVMAPPDPRMAKDVFRMRKYFTQIQVEGLKAITSMANQEDIQEEVQKKQLALEALPENKTIHEQYADDAPDKEEKLTKIESTIEALNSMMALCVDVDFYKMTQDFGKLLINNKRCTLKDKEGNSEPLNLAIWENEIQPQERLDAAVRYCCFFGLTSSMI